MEDIIFDHLIEEDKQLYLEHKIKIYHFICPECRQVYVTNKYNFKKSPRCKKCGERSLNTERKYLKMARKKAVVEESKVVEEPKKETTYSKKKKDEPSLTEEEKNFVSPAYNVKRVPFEKIFANNYNPNSQDQESFKLLYISIKEDGYTMPIVTYYHEDTDKYEIVDGFHRYSIMRVHKDIYEREKGMLPVVVIQKDLSERMSSTIRHNRARGTHSVDLMSNIVGELHKLGRSDNWIMEHIGMSKDEVVRLKQITGIAELFANKEFTEAWE